MLLSKPRLHEDGPLEDEIQWAPLLRHVHRQAVGNVRELAQALGRDYAYFGQRDHLFRSIVTDAPRTESGVISGT